MKVLIALLLATPVHAHDFPAHLAKYTCCTATFYTTTPKDTCMMEQYRWFFEVSQSKHYEKALPWGYHHNWRGDVIGVDFKRVRDRVLHIER